MRVLAVTFAALMLVGCTPKVEKRPDKPLFTTPSNTDEGLDPTLGPQVKVGRAKMQILAGWVSEAGAEMSWRAPIGTPGSPTMNVVVSAAPPEGMPDEVYWSELSTTYRAETMGVQTFVEEGPIQKGARRVYRFVVDREESGVGFRMFQVVVIGRRGVYIATFNAQQEAFESLRATFLRAALTLRE